MKKNKLDISNIIGYTLLGYGFIFMISCYFYIFKSLDERWFSRFCISLICFGFSGIIFKSNK